MGPAREPEAARRNPGGARPLTGLRADTIRLSPSASEAAEALGESKSHEARSILRRIESYRGTLLADCYHGEVVKKDRIPRSLREKYDLSNLYVEDLPAFWRLLYTIARDGDRRLIVVIEIVDHRTYDRWFAGR